jgi:hypothetical protein
MNDPHIKVSRPIVRIAIFAFILLNCSIAISFIYIWISAAQGDYFQHVDFTTFYTAGTIARDGLGRNMYDLGVQADFQAQILKESINPTDILPFNNPPFVVYPFILFAWLPLRSAFLLWTFIQLGLLFWLLYLLYQLSVTWSSPERWLMLTGVLAFTPLLIDFMLGTFSLLLLLCLFQFYLTFKNDRPMHSAAWLLVEFIKPQLALLPAVLLLGARRWRAMFTAFFLGLGLFVITSLSFGWCIWFDFIKNINSASTNFNSFAIVPAIEYNLKGFLTLLLGDSRASVINLISLAALFFSFGFVLWIWRGPWEFNLSILKVKFSLTIMLGLILSLHLNPYDSLLLVLPAVLFYDYLRENKPCGPAFGIFLLCCPYIFLIDFFLIRGRVGFHFPFVIMVVITLWIIGEYFFRTKIYDQKSTEVIA